MAGGLSPAPELRGLASPAGVLSSAGHCLLFPVSRKLSPPDKRAVCLIGFPGFWRLRGSIRETLPALARGRSNAKILSIVSGCWRCNQGSGQSPHSADQTAYPASVPKFG